MAFDITPKPARETPQRLIQSVDFTTDSDLLNWVRQVAENANISVGEAMRQMIRHCQDC